MGTSWMFRVHFVKLSTLLLLLLACQEAEARPLDATEEAVRSDNRKRPCVPSASGASAPSTCLYLLCEDAREYISS